jgi:hypothetical protein
MKDLDDINLSGFSGMRPDIYFWAKEEKDEKIVWKLFSIELCIPFGRGTEDDSDNT